MRAGDKRTTGTVPPRPRDLRTGRRARILAGGAVAVLAAGVFAAMAPAQAPTLTLQVPPVFKTKFHKSGKQKGLAKKPFKWTVSGSDSNPGAVLDVFVRPSTQPCAPTPSQESAAPPAGNGGQALIPLTGQPEPSIHGTFTMTRKLQPLKGASRLCAYLHTGDMTHAPDATATATFIAKTKR